jgi:uncharacterized protein YlxW (UPF0749 family)
MLKRYWQLAGVTGTMAILAPGQAGAQSSSVSSQEVRELREEIQALQRKVQQLEAKAAAPQKQVPSSSPQLHAHLQAGRRKGSSTWRSRFRLARRRSPSIRGRRCW